MPKKPKFILGGNIKYTVKTSKAFDKELIKVLKRGKDLHKLEKIVNTLSKDQKLSRKHHDHALNDNRNFANCRECHIEPDWLLVYRKKDDILTLTLLRTGSHSDLFKK